MRPYLLFLINNNMCILIAVHLLKGGAKKSYLATFPPCNFSAHIASANKTSTRFGPFAIKNINEYSDQDVEKINISGLANLSRGMDYRGLCNLSFSYV